MMEALHNLRLILKGLQYVVVSNNEKYKNH